MSQSEALTPLGTDLTLEVANQRCEGSLPGLIGVRFTRMDHGAVDGYLDVHPHHLAPNGYLHAATIVGLADTACGFGSSRSVPEGAIGFTTIEVKSNYIGTTREGRISTEARLTHGGRTTQVWDANVVHEETGKTIALFRCTQMILYGAKG